MATSVFFNLVNIGGIPCIENNNVTLTTENATYNFNSPRRPDPNFSGLIAVKIVDAAAPETAVPVRFSTVGIANSTVDLVTLGGTAVTTAGLVNGIHLVFYDRFSNTLQLLV